MLKNNTDEIIHIAVASDAADLVVDVGESKRIIVNDDVKSIFICSGEPKSSYIMLFDDKHYEKKALRCIDLSVFTRFDCELYLDKQQKNIVIKKFFYSFNMIKFSLLNTEANLKTIPIFHKRADVVKIWLLLCLRIIMLIAVILVNAYLANFAFEEQDILGIIAVLVVFIASAILSFVNIKFCMDFIFIKKKYNAILKRSKYLKEI